MQRCVFLDRDGVVNFKPAPGEYICRWEDFRLIPEVVDWIRLFHALGFLVVIVTNQRAVARGLLPAGELRSIHEKMARELQRAGAHLDDIFCCPHEESTCDCRKPKSGLIRQAQQKWNIDLGQSLMIGDSDSDQILARSCGMRFVRVSGGRIIGVNEPEAEFPCP
jgi:D-glycero-D-manno-heptose 1,7-bisphosphate phosphatase